MQLLLGRRGLARGLAGQNGVVAAAGMRKHDGQADCQNHEQHRSPTGQLRQQVGGAARTEGSLRALAAKCAGEIGRFSGLQQDNADEKQADDYKDNDEQVEKISHDEVARPLETGMTALAGRFEVDTARLKWSTIDSILIKVYHRVSKVSMR